MAAAQMCQRKEKITNFYKANEEFFLNLLSASKGLSKLQRHYSEMEYQSGRAMR